MDQPYFHDPVNAYFAFHGGEEWNRKHGVGLSINGVKYPARFTVAGESGNFRYTFNYFQPREME